MRNYFKPLFASCVVFEIFWSKASKISKLSAVLDYLNMHEDHKHGHAKIAPSFAGVVIARPKYLRHHIHWKHFKCCIYNYCGLNPYDEFLILLVCSVWCRSVKTKSFVHLHYIRHMKSSMSETGPMSSSGLVSCLNGRFMSFHCTKF